MKLTVRDGIGARVTAMANAMSRGGERLEFGWAVNEHCPLTSREVFPNGIDGVEFVQPVGDCPFAEWNGKPFFSWHGADDRRLADDAYARIIEAMAGSARVHAQMAIHGRFYRNPQADPKDLAKAAKREIQARAIQKVFLLSDRHRDIIRDGLPSMAHLLMAEASELTADLVRSRSDQMEFLSDWKTLLAAPVIVAIDGPSCMLNPARAAGREIIYAG